MHAVWKQLGNGSMDQYGNVSIGMLLDLRIYFRIADFKVSAITTTVFNLGDKFLLLCLVNTNNVVQ